MNNINFGVAFIAGMLSFLSPCILPLIPGYISFLSGLSLEELQSGTEQKKVIRKAGVRAILFVLGFSFVFLCLGASASVIGKFLSANLKILSKFAGIWIIILGLHLLGILKIKWLNIEKKFNLDRVSESSISAFFIGVAFAFGWTPCVGPILAGILTLAATQETVARGILLLGGYSLGLGVPFIIAGFSVGLFLQFFKGYKRFIRWGEILAGYLLIVVGVLIFSDNLITLLRFVPRFFFKFSQ